MGIKRVTSSTPSRGKLPDLGQLEVSLCLSGKPREKGSASLYSKMICAAYVHGGKASPKGDFADTFETESVCNTGIMPPGYHV
eukprot:386370-Pelagomonas_calceolata.AAC.1